MNRLATRSGLILSFCLLGSLISADPPKTSPQVDIPKEIYPVKPADLKFALHQVRTMETDRPEMKRYMTEDSPVFQWVVRQFAGASTGHHVYWSPKIDDLGSSNANHQQFYTGQEQEIRVALINRDGEKRPLTCEELWSDAIFELNNLTHDRDFTKAWEDAYKGRITKAQYVEIGTRGEYTALVETSQVFEKIWKPWALKHGVSAVGGFDWGQGLGSYEDWIAGYKDPNAYPWDSWGRDFDSLEKQGYPVKKGK